MLRALEAIFGQQLELPVRRYAACREGRCVPLALISLPFRIRRSRAADVRALLSVTFMQASPRRTDWTTYLTASSNRRRERGA